MNENRRMFKGMLTDTTDTRIPGSAGRSRTWTLVGFGVSIVLAGIGGLIIANATSDLTQIRAEASASASAVAAFEPVDLDAHSTSTLGQMTVEYADGTPTDHDLLGTWQSSGYSAGVPKGGTVTITVVIDTVTGKKKADRESTCSISAHPASMNDDEDSNTDGTDSAPKPYVTKTLHGKGTIVCSYTRQQ